MNKVSVMCSKYTIGYLFVFSVALSYLAVITQQATAQTTPLPKYEHIYSFKLGDLASPSGALLEIGNGVFIGAARSGGDINRGGVFKISGNGTYETFYSFKESDGYRSYSSGGLTLAHDGKIYGTNDFGGALGYGTIFRISPDSNLLEVVYNFDGVSGSRPNELAAGDGDEFFGTTQAGGLASIPGIRELRPGSGTIFKINSIGELTTFYVFHSYLNFGGITPRAGLLRANDGDYYGATSTSIPSDLFGNVFKISADGTYASIGGFLNGGSPVDKFAQGVDGTIYGVYPTGAGGYFNAYGSLFKVPYSIFGKEVLYFNEDYKSPKTVTTALTTGDLYITTANRIFSYSLSGGLQLVHEFDASVKEIHRLLSASDGNLYGVTNGGGENNLGIIFKIVLKVIEPTATPSPTPTFTPTQQPTIPLATPTSVVVPTAIPTSIPTSNPTNLPTPLPTPVSESVPTPFPTPTISSNQTPIILDSSCSVKTQKRKLVAICKATVSDSSKVKVIVVILDKKEMTLRLTKKRTYEGKVILPSSLKSVRKIQVIARDYSSNKTVRTLPAIKVRKTGNSR